MNPDAPHFASSANPRSAPSQERKLWYFKLILSLLVGLVSAAAGCLTGIYSLRQPHSWVCLPQRSTVWPKMRNLAQYLAEYKEEQGGYPLNLDDMTSRWTYNGKPLKQSNIDHRIRDGWENPMVYSSDGKTWELLSYGADGKPGGIGLDADIRKTDIDGLGFTLYKDSPPTIEQVVRSEYFNGPIASSMLAGIVGFILSLRQMFVFKTPNNKRSEVLLAAIGITIVTSFFVCAHVFVQSVASGH